MVHELARQTKVPPLMACGYPRLSARFPIDVRVHVAKPFSLWKRHFPQQCPCTAAAQVQIALFVQPVTVGCHRRRITKPRIIVRIAWCRQSVLHINAVVGYQCDAAKRRIATFVFTTVLHPLHKHPTYSAYGYGFCPRHMLSRLYRYCEESRAFTPYATSGA